MPRIAVEVAARSTVQVVPIDVPPKTTVKREASYDDDGKTNNALIVQEVSVPFVSKSQGKTRVETKDYLRIFVRPDEAHNEPDARWDEHEPEDEAALKQLFATYGKGSGTVLTIRHDVPEPSAVKPYYKPERVTACDEFFVDVRFPKPEAESDDRFPSVLVDLKSHIANIVWDLFYEMSGKDPPDNFKTRGALEDEIDEYSTLEDEEAQIRNLLDEFDMPGDKPARLYSLPERLRSIFETAKGKR